MKQSKLTIASAFVAALVATPAVADVYNVDIKANPGYVGEIIGVITVTGTTVTAFTGTASGFGFGGVFDGPTTLGQSPGGPSFVGDNQWAGAPYYVTAGDGGSGGGWLLTNGSYNFRIYDYTDAFNNYGDQLAWFGSSGYNPATIDVTISLTEVTPLPAAWTMMLIGGAGLGLAVRRRKAKTALA